MQIFPGVSYTVTAPVQYTMNYFNGSFTYNEPFVIFDFSKEVVDKYLLAADTWVHGVSAFFLNTGTGGAAVTLGLSAAVCSAVAAITEVAYNAIKGWVLNRDGSVSLCISYHYAGTRNGGIDLTATPIPGFDPNHWNKIVNGLMIFRTNARHANALGITDQAVKSLDSSPDFVAPQGHTPEGSHASVAAVRSFGNFSSSFASCMSANGLPVPSGAFETAERSIATVTAMYMAVKTYGTTVTIADLVGKAVLGDYLLVAGSLTASYYVGACIGCLMHAGINSIELPTVDW